MNSGASVGSLQWKIVAPATVFHHPQALFLISVKIGQLTKFVIILQPGEKSMTHTLRVVYRNEH